jgi:hypothetical protein
MVTIKRFYLLLLLASLVYALSTTADLNLPEISTLSVNYIMLGWALIAQIAFWAFMTIGWRLAVYYATNHKINIVDSFSQVSLLLIGKYIPGKIWGLIGRGAALKELRIDTRDIIKCTYIEQFISIHAGMVIGAIGVFFVLESFLKWIVLFTAFISLFTLPALNTHFNHLICRFLRLFKKTLEPLELSISHSHYTALFTWYVLEWLAIGAIMLFLILGFLPTNLTPLESVLIITFAASGMLAGFIALFAPGGIGIRESVIIYFLSTIIPLENAILVVVIYRLWLTAADIVAGALALSCSSFRTSQEPGRH